MKNLKDKISVIVPIYNVEAYLPICIESIIRQAYSNIQIILIDDGSTDNSGNICDEYMRQDRRIEVYHTKNNGLVVARKFGLKVSIGEYIGFVDADDYIEPNMFEELIDNIKKNNVDFVHFGFVEESSKESSIISNYYEAVFDIKDEADKIKFLCNHFLEQMDVTPSIWSKLFKSDFIKKCYKNVPDMQQYGEDMICLCCCILEADRISLSKKALYHYTVRDNSLSHLSNKKYIIKEIELLNCILNILEKYGCKKVVEESIYNFFKGRILHMVELISDKKVHIPRYYFVDLEQLYGKKIVIYGAGNVGQDYYTQIRQHNKSEIIAWSDSQWYKYHFEYSDIVGIEKIKNLKFDIVIIAVASEQIKTEIKKTLIKNGIKEEKIKWQKPGLYY